MDNNILPEDAFSMLNKKKSLQPRDDKKTKKFLQLINNYFSGKATLDHLSSCLKEGANIDGLMSNPKKNSKFSDRTPLYEAICRAKVELVKFLIQNGANLQVQDNGSPLLILVKGFLEKYESGDFNNHPKDIAQKIYESNKEIFKLIQDEISQKTNKTYAFKAVHYGRLIDQLGRAKSLPKDITKKITQIIVEDQVKGAELENSKKFRLFEVVVERPSKSEEKKKKDFIFQEFLNIKLV